MQRSVPKGFDQYLHNVTRTYALWSYGTALKLRTQFGGATPVLARNNDTPVMSTGIVTQNQIVPTLIGGQS